MSTAETMEVRKRVKEKLGAWLGYRSDNAEEDYWKGVNMGINISTILLTETLNEMTGRK